MGRSSLLATLLSITVVLSLPARSAVAQAPSLTGTWEGKLSSRNYAPAPVILVINQGVGAKLAGAINRFSPCLQEADLEIEIKGSTIVVAGSDPDGNTLTLKGSVDANGTHLAVTYILNGSVSGNCETDDGSGTLTKR